jgi:hypothetical protein
MTMGVRITPTPVRLERIAGDERGADLRITDERGHVITLHWTTDDVPEISAGPRWLLSDLLRRHGGRALRRALEIAATNGSAEL